MLEDTKHIKISDYDYPLPDERIAKFPLLRAYIAKVCCYRAWKVEI